MVKVKIPEKFCRFTFCPLCPLLRSPSVSLSLLLPLCLSIFLFPSLFFVAYRQSLFHSLRVFEKRPLINSLKTWHQRHPCRTDMVLHDRIFVSSFSFLPFSYFLFSSYLSLLITRAKRLDVSSVLSSTSRWLLVDFLSHIYVSDPSLSLPLSLSWLLMRNLRRIERTRRISLH